MRLTKLSSFYIPHFMLHIVQTNNCCHNVIGWQISEIPTFRILKKLKVFFSYFSWKPIFYPRSVKACWKAEIQTPLSWKYLLQQTHWEIQILLSWKYLLQQTLYIWGIWEKSEKWRRKIPVAANTLHPDKLRETLGWTFISVSSQIPNRAITKIYKYIRHSSTLVQL